MNRSNVLKNLKKLSVRLGEKVIIQKDVRTVPGLEYYISLHFEKLGKALRVAGLKSSELAEKMSISDEELLKYLRQLRKKLEKNPTTMDITRDRKFSYRIFKTRFGGLTQALNKIDAKDLTENDTLLLKYDLQRCIDLYNSGILSSDSIFAQSVFIEVIIKLNNILQTLDAQGKRINFTDDVGGEGVKDITELVRKLRNAACHDKTSGEAKIGTNTFIFNRIVGRIPNAIKIGNIVMGSDYDNETAFLYGDKKIYLKRHVERLLDEISKRLNEEKLYG